MGLAHESTAQLKEIVNGKLTQEYRAAAARQLAHRERGLVEYEPSDGLLSFAFLMAAVGIFLGAFGIYRMYAYDAEDKIVGGDAYNQIILAQRGVGFLVAGVIAVLFGILLHSHARLHVAVAAFQNEERRDADASATPDS